jgi:cell division protein FtsZ
MKFDILQDDRSIIKVIGIGGGGGNAINHMYRQGIKGVDFIICNTDAQALELSPIPNKVQLGPNLTEGRGAGSLPEVGKHAAIENIDQIKGLLGNTKMVFITAGMGGGTGTGASPIIAQAAHELGILTVGIVTTPFSFEGKRRRSQAEEGLEELRKNVDTLLVVSNDKLREMFGNLTLTNAFAEADNILTTAAKGIAEIITVPGYINVDFEDVKTVMKNSGAAVMGSWTASGDDRARKAVRGALSSPLLNDNEIEGARYILLNISSGQNEVLMDEVTIITDFIQEEAGLSADIIWGNCKDDTLVDELSVTIIATGFQTRRQKENTLIQNPGKIINVLDTNMETVKVSMDMSLNSHSKIQNTPKIPPVAEPWLDQIQIKSPVEASTVKSEPEMTKTPADESRSDKNDPYSWNFEPFIKTHPQPEVPMEKVIEPEPIPSQALHQETRKFLKEKEEFLRGPFTQEEFLKTYKKEEFSEPVRMEEREMERKSNPGREEGSEIIGLNENGIHNRNSPPLISPRQVSMFDFEMSSESGSGPQNTFRNTQPTPPSENSMNDDPMKRTKDRIMRLKELSMKLKTPKGLEDLENEPAYLRKNLKLSQVPHSSSQEELSRLTLSERDGITEIRSNNTFLHDNVD